MSKKTKNHSLNTFYKNMPKDQNFIKIKKSLENCFKQKKNILKCVFLEKIWENSFFERQKF